MIQRFLYLIGVCLMMSGCHTVTSDNGDLDGLWQQTTIENLQTGVFSDGRDVGSGVTWAFQGPLLSMRDGATEVIYSFQMGGDILKVYNPYFSGRFTDVADDIAIIDASQLNVFGLYQLEEHFKILQLDRSTMILESSHVRLSFRKY